MASALGAANRRRDCYQSVLRRSAMLALMVGFALMPAVLAQARDSPAASAPFDQCAVCHSTDGSNGTGPTLKGVSGRKSGTVPGFRYSGAMKSANITWSETALDRYLADPQGVVPGNVMAFSGIVDGVERAKIISYLMTLR
jgi:cytochrome c